MFFDDLARKYFLIKKSKNVFLTNDSKILFWSNRSQTFFIWKIISWTNDSKIFFWWKSSKVFFVSSYGSKIGIFFQLTIRQQIFDLKWSFLPYLVIKFFSFFLTTSINFWHYSTTVNKFCNKRFFVH